MFVRCLRIVYMAGAAAQSAFGRSASAERELCSDFAALNPGYTIPPLAPRALPG
jgi:hypothetical protein